MDEQGRHVEEVTLRGFCKTGPFWGDAPTLFFLQTSPFYPLPNNSASWFGIFPMALL